jgi:hypothetical protein
MLPKEYSIDFVGMTCFMTYSVYSLSFSNLFPQQSEYVMTITLYSMLSMAWTLLSMGWFVVCNYNTTEAKLPKPLKRFCGLLHRVFFCCFSQPKDDDISASATSIPKTKCVPYQRLFSACFRRRAKVEIVHMREHTNLEDMEGNNSKPAVAISINETTEEVKAKCNFCDRCQPCLADYEKDKAKGKNKKEIESKCSALNYFVFLCVLLFMFIANMVLWFSMAN